MVEVIASYIPSPYTLFFLLSGCATWFVVFVMGVHVRRDYLQARHHREYAEHVYDRVRNEHLAIQRLLETGHGIENGKDDRRRDSNHQSFFGRID